MRCWRLGMVALALAAWLGWALKPVRPVKAEAAPVTWRGQVAPVVYQSCAGCHHAGGSGPFDLTTYASAKRWAPQMADVVESRYMPPWLPETTGGPHPVHFEGDRRLKSSEVELLLAWVKAGAPEGSGPVPPAPVYSADWQMGPPDMVVEMPEAVTEPASGSDLFVNFVLPTTLKETRWVRAMEIQPGVGNLVHHANLIVDRTGSFRAAHPDTWRTGVPGMDLQIDSGDAFDPDSHFLFWKPDSTALVEPEGMPWRLDPGNDLLLNMHMKPTGKPEQVRVRIGLYFAAKPATAVPMLLQLEHDAALKIPPGDAHFVVTDELKLPEPVDVLGVYPHAHYLCREMEGWAVLPGGERQPLLRIADWDIDRQSVYQLAAPLALPAGTVLHMRYVYDNSAANVHNPHTPPVEVHGGNRATDEMSHFWLQVLPRGTGTGDRRVPLEQAWMEDALRKSPGDRIALYNLGAIAQMQGEYAQAEGYFRRLLEEQPRDVRALTALGSALEAAGDHAGATGQFRAALAVDPQNGDAGYDLALAEMRDGKRDAAERQFRAVLQQHPRDALAAQGLAQVLLDRGALGEAQQVLERLLKQTPDAAEAHHLLALVLFAKGDGDGALRELKAWSRLAPADPEAHRALAQLLSTAGQAEEAIAEQQKVIESGQAGAGDWNDLGTLEARAGRREAAQTAFERALALESGNQAARANLERLKTMR